MRQRVSMVAALLTVFTILTGCETAPSENMIEIPLETTKEMTDIDTDPNLYDYLEFLSEFTTNSANGPSDTILHYYIVRNISDTDMDFTLYGTAYDAKGKELGMAGGSILSLSPDDTFILTMALNDADNKTKAKVDHVEPILDKFFLTDNAYTNFGYDSHSITYSDTVEGGKVWVTATNNGDADAHAKVAVVFYKDSIPVLVDSGSVYDDDKNYVLTPGGTGVSYFRCPDVYDSYEVYTTAYAVF